MQTGVTCAYIHGMRHEVHGLRNFYATPAGLVAARLLREQLRALWPPQPGQRILGLGYASPFLRIWRSDGADCIALLTAQLPHWRWPRKALSATAVGSEEQLPLPDLIFDRVLLVHGLEHSENVRRLLREAWRVLKDDGRLLVVVPNRHGLWAYREKTPFGHGHPYSARQLEALLRRQMFTVERRASALFVPPFQTRLLLRGAGAWERLGKRFYPRVGGVVLLEAVKDFGEMLPAGQTMAPARRVVFEATGR
jgi:Methyltransferase domain